MEKSTNKYLWIIAASSLMVQPGISMAADSTAGAAAKIASYSFSIPAAASHADTEPPSVLTDGQWAGAAEQSVEFKNDVVVTAKLESAVKVKEAVAWFYSMKKGFVGSVGVEVSLNGKDWEPIAVKKVTEAEVQVGASVPAYELTIPVRSEAAYVRFSFKRAEGSMRILLGEIAVR